MKDLNEAQKERIAVMLDKGIERDGALGYHDHDGYLRGCDSREEAGDHGQSQW